MRKRFVQDNDSHWYLIDANKQQEFVAWANSLYENVGYEGDEFYADRIAGPIEGYTFTDPQED